MEATNGREKKLEDRSPLHMKLGKGGPVRRMMHLTARTRYKQVGDGWPDGSSHVPRIRVLPP